MLSRIEQWSTGPASLLYKHQYRPSDISPIQIAAEVMDHLMAGITSTGYGLYFLIYELSLPHNAVRQKHLYTEIINSPAAKLNELVYLHTVVKERLRLFPPDPMSFPRYVPAGGRQISGYDIPGGRTVSCQP